MNRIFEILKRPNYFVNNAGYVLRTDPFEQSKAGFDTGIEDFVDVSWPKTNKLVLPNFFTNTDKLVPMKWTTGATRSSSVSGKKSSGDFEQVSEEF